MRSREIYIYLEHQQYVHTLLLVKMCVDLTTKPAFVTFHRQTDNLKPTKHTQLSIPADCQLDPLQPSRHHNHYEQSNHQAHHSLLQPNVDNKIQNASSPTSAVVPDTSTLRSTTHSHNRLSPQMMAEPAENDDTDPDVIPNQYGK